MSSMERLKQDAATFKSARETPAGRRLELRLITANCNVLIVGCIGLAVWFPPLVFASAIGHLALGFVKRRNASNLIRFWFVGLVLSFVTIALSSGLVFAGTYGVQHYYFGMSRDLVVGELRVNWLFYVAIAVVLRGIVSVLFAHPGGAAQLVDHNDRTEADAKISKG